MGFYCFKCNKTFGSSKETIKHLRKNHFMIDNVEPIRCIVEQCDNTFNTFRGLSNHLTSFDHHELENVCAIKSFNIYIIYEFLPSQIQNNNLCRYHLIRKWLQNRWIWFLKIFRR